MWSQIRVRALCRVLCSFGRNVCTKDYELLTANVSWIPFAAHTIIESDTIIKEKGLKYLSFDVQTKNTVSYFNGATLLCFSLPQYSIFFIYNNSNNNDDVNIKK